MLEQKKISSIPSINNLTYAHAIPLADVTTTASGRVSSGIGELDRVLGGGIVPGSVTLLGGDPGIGKSTLLMQTAAELTKQGTVLYVTGEESASQLKLRAERLGVGGDMLILAENDLSAIESEVDRVKPALRNDRQHTDYVLGGLLRFKRQHIPDTGGHLPHHPHGKAHRARPHLS